MENDINTATAGIFIAIFNALDAETRDKIIGCLRHLQTDVAATISEARTLNSFCEMFEGIHNAHLPLRLEAAGQYLN